MCRLKLCIQSLSFPSSSSSILSAHSSVIVPEHWEGETDDPSQTTQSMIVSNLSLTTSAQPNFLTKVESSTKQWV